MIITLPCQNCGRLGSTETEIEEEDGSVISAYIECDYCWEITTYFWQLFNTDTVESGSLTTQEVYQIWQSESKVGLTDEGMLDFAFNCLIDELVKTDQLSNYVGDKIVRPK